MTQTGKARLSQSLVFATLSAILVLSLRFLERRAFVVFAAFAAFLIIGATLQAIGWLVESLWRMSGVISLRSLTPSSPKGDESECPPVTS